MFERGFTGRVKQVAVVKPVPQTPASFKSPAQMVDNTARDIADKTPVRIVSNNPPPAQEVMGPVAPRPGETKEEYTARITPPKDTYVPPSPGTRVGFENGVLVERTTLRPGQGSNLKWEVQPAVTNTATGETSQEYVLKGSITNPSKSEGITPTPEKQLRMPGSDIIRNVWYGKQTAPEQIWQSPDARYSYGPSSKSVLAESFVNVGIGLTGGSIIRTASAAADTARVGSFLSHVNKATKIVMGGTMITGAGADVIKTGYDIGSGAMAGTQVGVKVISTGAGLFGFVYGASGRGFTQLPKPVTTSGRTFREPQSMFENKYIKDIIGYKTKPTTQIKIDEIPGNKYLITNKEMIKLESTGLRTPTIRTTMAEKPMEFLGLNKNIAPSKTIQLSVYGAKIYEKPTTPTSYPSKVPWRFESITRQTKLEPTNTWIDIRFENGKLITKEIPYEKVRFFDDTRAEQSLMLLRERPTKPLFRSEIYTKIEESYKPASFIRFGLLQPPFEKQLTYTGQFDIPAVKSASLDAMMYGELQKQKQETNMSQRLRDMTKQRDEQEYLPASLQVQKQTQRQSQAQKQDMIVEQVMKNQDRSIKDSITKFTPGLFRLPMDSARMFSGKPEQEGFNVFIKDRSYVHGKKRYAESWKKANTTPLSEEAALSLGGTAVDQSAAASFKIRPTEGKAKALKIGVDPWGVLSGKFYKSKGTYIESTSNRIDSQGEIKGISALGWIANQRRTMFSPTPARIDFKATTASKNTRVVYDIDFNKIMRGVGL